MDDKKINNIEIVAKDFYGENCIVDSALAKKNTSSRKPEGMVEIYDVLDDGRKQLVRKSNLVIYQGRETLAQMLVRVNTVDDEFNPPASPIAGNKDHFLCWFGLGQGAADTEACEGSGSIFEPYQPKNSDLELSCPVMINPTDSSCGDYHVIGDPDYPGGNCQESNGLYPATGYYKHPFSSVTFEQDNLNENRWIVIKVNTTIGIDDANGSERQALNEAGLYTAESNMGAYGTSADDFALFAKVTFPTLLKDNTRRLQFSWYIFV